MEPNMSQSERRFRFTTGSLIWILYLNQVLQGDVAHIMAVVGVIFVATAVMNFCPYYLILGISSNDNSGR